MKLQSSLMARVTRFRVRRSALHLLNSVASITHEISAVCFLAGMSLMVFAFVSEANAQTCGNAIVETGEGCDDGNHSHGDCCGPTCQFDVAGSVCLDDGDACTDDVCDGGGVCLHVTTAAACDARLCYKAKSTVATPSVPIELANAFEVHDGASRSPSALCAPAELDGAAVDDTKVYYEAYRLQTAPRRVYRQDVLVEDHFGAHRLRILKPERLLLGTSVGLDEPAGPAPPLGVADPHECYRVRRASREPTFPERAEVALSDAIGYRRFYDVIAPTRLCLPTALAGATVARPLAHLLCFKLQLATGEPAVPPLVGRIQTLNLLGAGRLDVERGRELCLPAIRDRCGVLPQCRELPVPGQNADCRYDPAITDPAHSFCRGPKIVVDASHGNFHVIQAASGSAGRWWGFAKLLLNDGYDVQQSSEPLKTLLRPSDVAVLVIANPTPLVGDRDTEAVPNGDVQAIVDWVAAGGSLLLVIDHTPYEQVGGLLGAIGLVRLPEGVSPETTFTSADGTLNGAAAVAMGPGPDTTIDAVTTFTGTAFSVAEQPPDGAQYEPVLIFPAGSLGTTNESEVDLGGMLEAVAIRFGAGRIFVSGEAGGLTAQTTMGMQYTPQNERYLRNVLWWLTE